MSTNESNQYNLKNLSDSSLDSPPQQAPRLKTNVFPFKNRWITIIFFSIIFFSIMGSILFLSFRSGTTAFKKLATETIPPSSGTPQPNSISDFIFSKLFLRNINDNKIPNQSDVHIGASSTSQTDPSQPTSQRVGKGQKSSPFTKTPLGNQTDSASGGSGGNTSSGGGNSSGGGSTSDSGQNASVDTSDWNSFTNGNYGYVVKYPNDWVAEQTIITSAMQSTIFHTVVNPAVVIAIFYIRLISINNQPFQQSELLLLQNQYQTKVHITSEGVGYSYQCVPVLDNAIVQICSTIESTIEFEK